MTAAYSSPPRMGRSTASVVFIDPPMARRWLEKNTRNRPTSDAEVLRLAEEMQAGRWQYNGEAIKWSVDDVILDGQHRLMALALLDDSVSLPFLVVRGLPTESQDTMDQGRSRSAGDQLAIDGLSTGSDSRVLAGAIRVFIPWAAGQLFIDTKRLRASNPALIAWAKSHPDEMALMRSILTDPIRRKVKCRPSVTLAVLLRFHLIDHEDAQRFAEGLTTGAGLEPGNPILTLRDRLDRIRTQGIRTSDRDYIGYFVVAWNAWREGRTLDRVQRPHGGTWTADTFPVPK